MRHHSYDGPEPLLVRRAAITLKSCDDWANGSLVAAPTSSIPAPVGGVRNWDYRYTWVRDAAFSVWALRRIGCEDEVSGFLGWVLDAFEGTRSPRIMYDVADGEVPDEWEDPELEGYRASAQVRWGNGAADQRQHDVYGEVLDCAHLRVANGRPIDARLWERLATLADAANIAWRQPDQGIWEVRIEGRVFTYSAAMCQVALDRAARIARRLGFGARAAAWGTAAERLRQTVLNEAWNEQRRTLTEHLGAGESIDASLLALPLRRVVAADDPRMVATTAAVTERLRPATAYCSATGTTSHPTASRVTREHSCCAASGWSTTSRSKAGSSRRPSSIRHCALGPAHGGCCPSRSTLRRASSPATSRRRSATSALYPAG